MLRVVHIINGLGLGGAEGMLVRLVEHMNPRRFQNVVITLGGGGILRRRLENAGIHTYSLGMRGQLLDCAAALRCMHLLTRLRPDCVHSWLYHSDLVAVVATRTFIRLLLVWSIRNAGPVGCSKRTRLLARVCAWLSPLTDAIVANSERGRLAHAQIGYDARRIVVIPNGFDLQELRIDLSRRGIARGQLGIAADSLVVALFARFHPVKDHGTFFQAASLLARRVPTSRFLLCGRGVCQENSTLVRMIPHELLNAVHLLGERENVSELLPAADVVTCSSRCEGFPNVLAEAMACGIPCVSTDVGDARVIIGDTGIIVPPGDPSALAAGWKSLLDLPTRRRQELGELARRRIAERFEIGEIARRYEALYESVVSKRFATSGVASERKGALTP